MKIMNEWLYLSHKQSQRSLQQFSMNTIEWSLAEGTGFQFQGHDLLLKQQDTEMKNLWLNQ